MPFVAQKLCGGGFTLELLQRVNNDVLLDQLLQGAGAEKAGDWLKVILFMRDAPLAAVKIKITLIASGDFDSEF